jgi:lipopolysaccharide export system permease protein
MQFLWRYIEDLVGKGLDFPIILKLLIFISTTLIPLSLPLAVLLASLMAFGNLGENYELVALKASGISLQKAMRPLIVFVFFVSIGAFYFANNVIPSANLKMKSLMYDIKRKKPEFQIREGTFYNDIDGYSIRVKKKNNETGLLKDLMIYDHTDKKGNIKLTVADSGYIKMTKNEDKLVISLYNGYSYIEIPQDRKEKKYNYPHRRDKFKRQEVVLDLTGFGLHRSDETLFKREHKMMNLAQLQSMEDTLSSEIDTRRSDFVDAVLKTNYFKSPKLIEKLDKDTLFSSGKQYSASFFKSHFFNNLQLMDQKRIVSRALNYARNTKTYTNSRSSFIKNRIKQLYFYQIEWHRKFTLSLACLIFFFIGAPLGAIIRKGGFGTPIVISVIVFILYYVITMFGENLVEDLVLTPFQGMWIPTLIILPFGIFLTYKATTDSSILDIETYMNFIKKVGRLFKNKQPNYT